MLVISEPLRDELTSLLPDTYPQLLSLSRNVVAADKGPQRWALAALCAGLVTVSVIRFLG